MSDKSATCKHCNEKIAPRTHAGSLIWMDVVGWAHCEARELQLHEPRLDLPADLSRETIEKWLHERP